MLENTGEVTEVMQISFSSPIHKSIYDFTRKEPKYTLICK